MSRYLSVCLVAGVALLGGPATGGVWTACITDGIQADEKPGDGKVLELLGPVNGTGVGQAIAASSGEIRNLKAICTDMKGQGGVIAASAVSIGYATRYVDVVTGEHRYYGRKDIRLWQTEYFDAVAPAPLGGEKVQPVVVHVTIPPDATPGSYSGTLTITGDVSGTVPVKLTVGPFCLPANSAFIQNLSLNQSPHTLAARYRVPMWSDRHWTYLERSMRLRGQLGTHVLYVPVLWDQPLGFGPKLITFREADGELTPDFGLFDRYYKLHVKYCGKPRALILGIWGKWLNGRREGFDPTRAEITLAAGGKYERHAVDVYPKNEAFWQAILAGMQQRLKAEGLDPEKVLHLGNGYDAKPTDEQYAFWKKLAPQLGWAYWTHGYGGKPRDVTYIETVDWTSTRSAVQGGWGAEYMGLNAYRDAHKDSSHPGRLRPAPYLTHSFNKGYRTTGLARVGLDYWPVLPENAKKRNGTYWPNGLLAPKDKKTHPGRVYRSRTCALTAAGDGGAVPTIRFYAVEEGIQETEARLCIEKALREKKLDGELKTRAETVLLELFDAMGVKQIKDRKNPEIDWRPTVRKLYEVAAEVQALSK